MLNEDNNVLDVDQQLWKIILVKNKRQNIGFSD